MPIFTLRKSILASILLLTFGASHAQDKQFSAVAGKDNYTSFTTHGKTPDRDWLNLNKGFSTHPDALVRPQFADPTDMVEVFANRTESSKYFVNPSKTSEFVKEQSTGAINFYKDGQWLTIDSRLSRLNTGIFEASRQEEPVGFDIQRKASYIKAQGGTVYFNQWALYGEQNGVATLLAKANWSNYTVGDDGMHFINIFPGIDANMAVKKGTVKTSFVINSNQFAGYNTLLFKDDFQSGQASSLSFASSNAGTTAISDVDYKVSGKKSFKYRKRHCLYQCIYRGSRGLSGFSV